MTESWRQRIGRWAPWALPPLLAFVLHAETIGNGFVRDDKRIVAQNVVIRDLSNIGAILKSSYWSEAAGAGLWRPFTLLTYALNHAVGGLNPWGFHLVNVVLHALVALLVSALLLALSGSRPVALTAGLLFAAHPVNVEAVANVVGRADILAALFVLLALLAHRASTTREGAAALRFHAASAGAFALALACKENALTFLALPPLHDACLLRGAGARSARSAWAVLKARARWYAAFVALAGACIATRVVLLGDVTRKAVSAQANPLAHVGTGARLAGAVALLGRYGRLFLFPRTLQCDYSLNAIPAQTSPAWFLVGLTIVAAAVVGFAWAWRRSPEIAFLVGMLAVTYSATSNAVVPIGTIMGERLMYLPGVACCGLAAIGLTRLAAFPAVSRRLGSLALPALVALVLVPLSWRTITRGLDWRSERTLYLRDAATAPNCAALRFNAGSILVDSGQAAEAIPHLEASLLILPTPEATFYLARAHGSLGHDDMRTDFYRRTAEQYPDTYFGHFAHGWLSAHDKQYEEARDHYAAAVRLRPEDGVARFNLGILQLALGDAAAAATELEQAGGLSPRSERTRLESLGEAYEKLGRFTEAAATYRTGATTFPEAAADFEKRAARAEVRALR